MERSVSFQDERKPQIVFYDIELDDAGLNPYEFRAYQRIARRCAGLQEGECFESLQAIADACKMSRPTLIRAIKVLLQRRMIRRISRHGGTSFYALTDKQNWLSFDQWEQTYRPEPGKPQNQGVVNHRTRGGKPQNQGVVHTFTHKNTHEENKKENKREKEHSPSLDSKNLTSILLTAYENIAKGYQEIQRVEKQAIILESENFQASDVEAWLKAKQSRSGINFIAEDFRKWFDGQSRKITASNYPALPTVKAPADYAQFYKDAA